MRLVNTIGAVALLGMLVATGCSKTRLITITTKPTGATVFVDGQEVGKSPIPEHPFDFAEKKNFVIGAKAESFKDAEGIITLQSEAARVGTMSLWLQPDDTPQSWDDVLKELEQVARQEFTRTTTGSDANNKWLKIAVHEGYTFQEAWSKINDAVTTLYTNLEQNDAASGYIKSAFKQERKAVDTASVAKVTTIAANKRAMIERFFKTRKHAEWVLRNRVIVGVASQSPLVFKVMIVSEWTKVDETQPQDLWTWTPFDRVMSADADMLEQLGNRLSTKIK